MAYNYDRRNRVRPLPILSPGTPVRIRTEKEKSWCQQGTVTGMDNGERSLTVKTPEGGVYRRNRKHILSDNSNSRQSIQRPEISSLPTTAVDSSPCVHSDGAKAITVAQPSTGNVVTRSGREVKPVIRMDV